MAEDKVTLPISTSTFLRISCSVIAILLLVTFLYTSPQPLIDQLPGAISRISQPIYFADHHEVINRTVEKIGDSSIVNIYEKPPLVPAPDVHEMMQAHRNGTTMLGSRSNSLVYIKAYKIGGTTASSILSAFAFNSNLHMAQTYDFCKGQNLKTDGKCVDIMGTNHPSPIPCNFDLAHTNGFCNSPEVFMMIREPVERLWSGYRHEMRLTKSLTMQKYLSSKKLTRIPTHHLINKDVNKAIQKAKQSINILLNHMYDESLVFMAMKIGLKLCDVMYPPCDSSWWGATKCNNVKKKMTETDRELLLREVTRSREKEFYEKLVVEAEKKLSSKQVKDLTLEYRQIKDKAVVYCKKPGILDAVKAYMKAHPYVRSAGKNFHFQSEHVHPLDPMTVCLGWFCHGMKNI